MPTPAEPGQPHDRPVLEPIRVLRPRNTDALAELFREMTEDTGPYDTVRLPDRRTDGETRPDGGPGADGETRAGGGPRAGGGTRAGGGPRAGGEARTERLPSAAGRETARGTGARTRRPAPAAGRRAPRETGGGPHRVAVASVAVLTAALVGFACALLLPGRGQEAAVGTPPATPAPATSAPAASAPAPTPPAASDPDGAGTLREGDTGPGVTDLQQRLRRIPNVYDDGPTDGRYDTVLTEAVARFQVWYGIRGDESGVYGDDTRRDLESRTG